MAQLKAGSTVDGKPIMTTGNTNTDIEKITAFIMPVDTRSWIPTAYDANFPDKPTHIDIKDGTTVVATLDITYNSNGKITQLVASDGTTTITYTVTWNGYQWTGTTKVVS